MADPIPAGGAAPRGQHEPVFVDLNSEHEENSDTCSHLAAFLRRVGEWVRLGWPKNGKSMMESWSMLCMWRNPACMTWRDQGRSVPSQDSTDERQIRRVCPKLASPLLGQNGLKMWC
jgi:hypothetical protein